jgi:hypothetical protein
MTSRADATPLYLGDRFYLVLEALNMIEEGIAALHDEAVDDGIDPDDEHMLESLNELRTTSYASLLHTMVNDSGEAKAMVAFLKNHNEELNKE